MGKKSSQIFTIYGQIEAAAAEHMIEKHGAVKIPVDDTFPPTQLYNERNERAQFAVLIPAGKLPLFEATIRNLRA